MRTNLICAVFVLTAVMLSSSVVANEIEAEVNQDGGSIPAIAENRSGVQFDTDRDIWLVDTDGDTYPDLTEEIGGTDPLNAEDYPKSDSASVNLGEGENASEAGVESFPASCSSGFRRYNKVCITPLQGRAYFRNAELYCKYKNYAHVCTYDDLFYVYINSSADALYNPYGRWLGHRTNDDRVLIGNKSVTYNNDPDIFNFEGEAREFDYRYYYCCHDYNR